MAPELRLRPMTDNEYATYCAASVPLLAEAESKAFGLDAAEARIRAAAAFERLIPNGLLAASAQRIYVIERDSVYVGVIWLELRNDNRDAYVYDLIIWPEYRRLGYGRQVLLIMETLLREWGVGRVILNVFSHNTVARLLYESLGYSSRSHLMMKEL